MSSLTENNKIQRSRKLANFKKHLDKAKYNPENLERAYRQWNISNQNYNNKLARPPQPLTRKRNHLQPLTRKRNHLPPLTIRKRNHLPPLNIKPKLPPLNIKPKLPQPRVLSPVKKRTIRNRLKAFFGFRVY